MVSKKLLSKAVIADGKERHCSKCSFNPCSAIMLCVCSEAFRRGFVKGYLTAKKESNLQARLQQENEEFKAFAKENYFDILSDYYPQFLIEKE